jgi:hypothetical protein
MPSQTTPNPKRPGTPRTPRGRSLRALPLANRCPTGHAGDRTRRGVRAAIDVGSGLGAVASQPHALGGWERTDRDTAKVVDLQARQIPVPDEYQHAAHAFAVLVQNNSLIRYRMGNARRRWRGVKGKVNRRTTASAEPNYPCRIDLIEKRIATVKVRVVQQRKQRGPLLRLEWSWRLDHAR